MSILGHKRMKINASFAVWLSSRSPSRRQDRGVSLVRDEGALAMHYLPRRPYPDLGVRKLSKVPCRDALFSRKRLTYSILLAAIAVFSRVFPVRQGNPRGHRLPARFGAAIRVDQQNFGPERDEALRQ